MARSSTSFKPGNKMGNGRPKLPDDLKELMRSTGEQIKRDICEVLAMDLGELHGLSGKTSGITVGRAAILSCINQVVQNGESKILSVFYDRILGKPIEVEVDNTQATTDLEREKHVQDLVHMLLDKPR